ncbi:hypothetical protein GUJ93_ZPchr0006g44742 [Zizania palustris]|uniref:Uncharacterized protein n=1 Tax=Zizania palustris TaxID=103762 RepID=A0A8J5T737_ZIZPA|nr:hypothetical protein GUJ93_ZPchr0006g44742 [Zizania palustris]
MGEKATGGVVEDQEGGHAAAAQDGIQYCSEHPYRSAAAAAAVAGGGICAFCLQEKLGRLVSSSKFSPFGTLGGHPPPSASPSSPPSFRRAAELPPPLHSSGVSRKLIPFHRKKTSSSSSLSSSSASMALAGGGLKRSMSVAPKPEEHFSSSASSVTAESPRKKSFWSFLYLSSSLPYTHQAATSTSYTNSGAAGRRKSVSVASAAWASRAGSGPGAHEQQPRAATSSASGRSLEVIGEPESPRQVSSSSSFGRKVARSRSVGCGSRSFSGDFLERISNGFGDCTLRRVESQREHKTNKMHALGHLGDGGADDDVYDHQHRIKCAGFFGGMGPTTSSYWLPEAEGGAAVAAGSAKKSDGRSHRSWAWAALASPIRALRPTSATTFTKTITTMPSRHVVVNSNGSTPAPALPVSSPVPPSSTAAARD